MNITQLSPGMQQYFEIKSKYEDCILLYRLGDFYEMFYDDAVTASKVLDLVLTAKNCGNGDKAPMCGVPFHAAQTYIAKLVSAGHKVAICEQLTAPIKGKKTIDRDVVRVITPGTLIDDEMLDGNKNNYLLSVCLNRDKLGASYIDISTGDFEAIEIVENREQQLSDLLSRINPSEIIGNDLAEEFYNNLPVVKLGNSNKLHPYYQWAFEKTRANDNLIKQLGENYQSVYGLKGKNEVISSAGALIEYINETQKRALSGINHIKLVKNNKFMTIDLNTRRNLEIVEASRDHKKYGSILWVLDKTKTSMGGRALRKMIDEPLQDAKEINKRLDGVQELTKKLIMRDNILSILSGIYDIERITGKISYGNVSPKDMVTLKHSLSKLPELKGELSKAESDILQECGQAIVDVSDAEKLLDEAIDENAPAFSRDGGFIKSGFNHELDDYRQAKTLANKWIEDLEKREIEATGIKNLKIKFNKVFGFFIEVNRSQIDKVPLRYQRKQTVLNNERYITEDLKVIEEKVLGSEEKALALENHILGEIKNILTRYIQSFQSISKSVALVDALISLAVVASKNGYVRPTISSSVKQLHIVDGRHPVVEQFLPNGNFIANDTLLDEEENKIMILTGPNMAGKSTYMRQVAIITFLAHIGSFVPAKEASVPITDRIFTRVGASDDLAFGQSTFMVEMSEVAHIIANATDKSLIVLDEIGRGTSTFDGLSIAWAVVEYLAKNFKAKTLFATHYHELTELEGVLDGVKNYKISVKEIDDKVVFLRKIVRGGANKSFGIEVARLAGVPKDVLDRAKEISRNLEEVNQKLDLNIFKENKEKAKENTKVALEILSTLKDIDINRISPIYAFDILNDLTKKAKEEK